MGTYGRPAVRRRLHGAAILIAIVMASLWVYAIWNALNTSADTLLVHVAYFIMMLGFVSSNTYQCYHAVRQHGIRNTIHIEPSYVVSSVMAIAATTGLLTAVIMRNELVAVAFTGAILLLQLTKAVLDLP